MKQGEFLEEYAILSVFEEEEKSFLAMLLQTIASLTRSSLLSARESHASRIHITQRTVFESREQTKRLCSAPVGTYTGLAKFGLQRGPFVKVFGGQVQSKNSPMSWLDFWTGTKKSPERPCESVGAR